MLSSVSRFQTKSLLGQPLCVTFVDSLQIRAGIGVSIRGWIFRGLIIFKVPLIGTCVNECSLLKTDLNLAFTAFLKSNLHRRRNEKQWLNQSQPLQSSPLPHLKTALFQFHRCATCSSHPELTLYKSSLPLTWSCWLYVFWGPALIPSSLASDMICNW